MRRASKCISIMPDGTVTIFKPKVKQNKAEDGKATIEFVNGEWIVRVVK